MPMNYDKFFDRISNQKVNNGITTYTIRKNKLIGESTIQSMRQGKSIRMHILCRLCYLLDCQPGDIMTYIPDEKDVQGITKA